MKIRCNNCEKIFDGDEDLTQLTDLNGEGKEIEYYLGCPDCKTDEYLMDIEDNEGESDPIQKVYH